jgi:hypothetical protein
MSARGVAVAATAVVAVVAAITSYDHMRTLAERAGEGWKSLVIPLAVDGLVISASTVLVVRRRAGVPGGMLPWLALLGGLGASVAANVAAAEPTAVGRAVALVPPLALAISFELLRTLMSAGHPPTPALAPAERSAAGEDHPAPPTDHPNPADAGESQPEPDPAPAPADPPSLVDQAAAVVAEAAQNGQRVGRRALAQQLGVSEHQARGLLTQATTGGIR